MSDGREIWEAAEQGTKTGDLRSANCMRLFALGQILAQAETAVLVGDDQAAFAALHDLRVHTDKMIEHLSNPAALVAA